MLVMLLLCLMLYLVVCIDSVKLLGENIVGV